MMGQNYLDSLSICDQYLGAYTLTCMIVSQHADIGSITLKGFCFHSKPYYLIISASYLMV